MQFSRDYYLFSASSAASESSFWQSQWEEFKKVFIHVPFVVPIRNLYNAYRLYKLGFGTEEFNEKDWKTVEEIQHEAGINGMQESFMEAAPQAIVQLVVVFSTGRISKAQWVSIPLSLFSLAWASSRVFFILRTRDESDPDPNVKTLFLRILPWELLIVLNSTILWTMIGGLLGKYVFIGVFLSFLVILGALHIIQSLNKKRFDTWEDQTREEEDLKITSALTSIWLPSVVSSSRSNFFITASIVSLINKILLLATAVLLVNFTNIDTHPFLLWCRDHTEFNNTITFNQSFTEDNITTSQMAPQENTNKTLLRFTYCQYPPDSLPSCLDDVGLRHKIRICGEMEQESFFRLGMLLLVVVSSMLSLWASYHLHKVSNYTNLYKQTTKILCCISTRPEIHRSVVFELSRSDANHNKLKEMVAKSRPKKNKYNPMVNRPNRHGETPLHNSTKAGAKICTTVLLQAGAIPRRNFENTLPEIGDQLYDVEVIKMLQESKERGELPNHLLMALDKQSKRSNSAATQSSVKAQLNLLLSLAGDGSYIAKQNCTLWNYELETGTYVTAAISKYDSVECKVT